MMEIPEDASTLAEIVEFLSQLPGETTAGIMHMPNTSSQVIVDRTGGAQLVKDDEGGMLIVIVRLD